MEPPGLDTGLYRYISPKIRVSKSGIQGYGWYALEDIEAGEVLWQNEDFINQKYYTESELEEFDKEIWHQVWQFDDDKFMIIAKEDPNYYQNHSCDPNTWYEGIFKMTARKSIKKGEELTYDYCMSEGNESEIIFEDCGCGSSNCRKRVTGGDWKFEELQKRYENHFLPYIMKKFQ
eukprot:TRINITY_DN4079_c0_g1_i2.p1 TRINITY_DN4079_c0_g1~~TRINITY_DN4079_c0_g1_i2.p1  ORF type:complete len:176 (+),score=25.81 TRINITY_DN4079_c0_g1_i2:358-885(+)